MTTINKLSAIDTLAAGDQFVVYSQLNGDARHFPNTCLLYTSPSPRDGLLSRMPSSA